MKQLSKYLFLYFAAMMVLAGCNKKDLDTSYPINGLGGDTWAKGPIDQWIYDTLTVPFNMEVLYKWDQFNDGDLTKTLVPPDENKVIPLLSTIKKIWIDPYVKAGGLTFMKRLIPKQIALVGSPSYNSNGSITLGEAEGGKKILLYTVNDFTLTNRDAVKRRMRTIQHEFGHILHQNILFTPDYERITAGDYTGDWTNQSLATALSKGFISPYAMSAKEEDFVEMIAHMLVEGPDGFDALVNSSSTAAGKAALRKKQSIVIAYYKTAWNIDFTQLQRYVADALDALSPLPLTPLYQLVGFTKQYQSIRGHIDMQKSAGFIQAYNTADATLKNIGTARYTIDSVSLRFNKIDTATVTIKFYSANAPATVYSAFFKYKFTATAAGVFTFGPAVTTGHEAQFSNARLIAPYVNALTDLYTAHTFSASWPNGKPDRFAPVQIGGWYATDDPALYMLGALSSSAD